MKIGIDCRTIQEAEPAGTARYTFELVQALLDIDDKNNYVLFFNKEPGKELFDKPNVKIVLLPHSKISFISNHVLFSQALSREKLDVFHGTANMIPIGYGKNCVLTIHDLAIYQNPEWFPPQGFSTRIVVPKSIAKAKKIIAVSESTKHDLMRIFRVPKEKIEVIYEGAPSAPPALEDGLLDRFGLRTSEPYFLFIGTIEPRKNLATLLSAYRLLCQKHTNAPRLIFAGGRGWKNEDFFETIKKWNLDSRVSLLGYVSEKEKQALLQHAMVFVYPSLYEGFGLPILEAMALGTPVLSSRTSSIPEVVGGAAVLVDPNDDEEIAKGLEKLWKDASFRSELIAKGKERVKLFDWKKTAEKTLRVYQGVEKFL